MYPTVFAVAYKLLGILHMDSRTLVVSIFHVMLLILLALSYYGCYAMFWQNWTNTIFYLSLVYFGQATLGQ